MSFLAQLLGKRKELKDAETVVTCPDGRRFIESKNHRGTKLLNDNTFGFVVDTTADDIPAEIITSLFLGSQDCCQPQVLEKYHIECVLSVGIKPFHHCPNITYKFVECYDLPDADIVKVLLKDCIPFIAKSLQSGRNILVHCNAGVSRSTSIVIGYLIHVNKIRYDEALKIVKEKRNCVKPNVGFETQLRNFSSNIG